MLEMLEILFLIWDLYVDFYLYCYFDENILFKLFRLSDRFIDVILLEKRLELRSFYSRTELNLALMF